MKAKHVKSVLRRKFDAWVRSISVESLREAIEEGAIITGGSITSMLMGDAVNDYDVYFKTLDTAKRVAEYYVTQFKANPPPKFAATGADLPISVMAIGDRVKIVVQSAGIAGEAEQDSYQYFETVEDPSAAEEYVERALDATDKTTGDEKPEDKPKYRPVFISANAITLSDKVQICIRFYGDADKIHENYDFIHCTCSWDAKTGELRLPPKALEAMLAKDLHYMGGSKYPLCSIIRTRKFLQRGWKINAGQYVKMAWDLNSLDLTDLEVLEDQMTGVDAAYFTEVVAALRAKDGKCVDGTYLMQIIDRIF